MKLTINTNLNIKLNPSSKSVQELGKDLSKAKAKLRKWQTEEQISRERLIKTPECDFTLNQLIEERKNIEFANRELRQLNESVVAPIHNAMRNIVHLCSGRWAGGENGLTIIIGAKKPLASRDSYTEWSSNGKWRGLSARYRIELPCFWHKTVHAEGIAKIGGYITLWAKKIDDTRYQAIVATNVRGCSVVMEKCVIVKHPATETEQAWNEITKCKRIINRRKAA